MDRIHNWLHTCVCQESIKPIKNSYIYFSFTISDNSGYIFKFFFMFVISM